MSASLEQLEELLPELPSAMERRRIGESLGKTAEAIKDSAYQIRRLTAVLEIARQTHFKSDINQAEALRELVEASKDTAEMMLKAETSDQLRLVQDSYKELIAILVQVDRQLRPHWRRIAERDFAPLTAIGSLLAQIDNTSGLGRRLIACGNKAEELSDRAGADVLRDSIKMLCEEREKLEAERMLVTNDREVDAFLNALAAGDATLQMITERVHAWLKNNGALDRFAVIPRSSD